MISKTPFPKSFQSLNSISSISLVTLSFLVLFAISSVASAKDILRMNDQIITTDRIIADARTFLSQNLTAETIDSLTLEQLKALAQSIMVKRFLFNQASQNEKITESLKPGGELGSALNALRIDIISEAYLEDIAQEVVTDEMVSEQYEAYKTQMTNAVEYQLEAIITSSKDEAEKAREEINQGVLFSDVAEKYSIDPSVSENRGILGKVLSLQLSSELREELEPLRVYELSEIVQVGDNFTIARYSAKFKPEVREFDEISANIRQELIASSKGQFINQIAQQIAGQLKEIDQTSESTDD